MNHTHSESRKTTRTSWVPPSLTSAAIHACLFASCGALAFLLRLDFHIEPQLLPSFFSAVGAWVVVKSLAFQTARLNRISADHVSLPDAIGIFVANVIGSVVSGIAIAAAAPPGFPRSVYFIDFFVCLVATLGVRIVTRLSHDKAVSGTRNRQTAKRIFIYGAGGGGAMLLREIRINPELGYRVCGFLDDDPRKTGMLLQRIPVLGPGSELPALAHKHGVEEVVITIPSAAGPEMARIFQYCHDAGIPCKTMPSIAEWMEGTGAAVQIREVEVEDLLGRNPVTLEQEQIRERLQNRVVMVTGAAGSIGSELCRQIARFDPQAIIGFEISETALFYLEQEMRSSFPNVTFYAEIGTIQNILRLRETMRAYKPSIVYHAAAYKHVPLMEKHVLEAVENNVFGTWNVATVAAEFRVEDFVMISSDKAVHPTSIMGTTKRIAEMLISSFQIPGTKYVSVRFGNVLGSNGSVVPIFKKQIASGGPVTVTHPEMQRYFMTIPEAAQLVLQASTMGRSNEMFVLDMGQPVKIVDLARNLILLSGLRPEEDIRIEFSGTRPGEKLYEEINSLNENTKDTYHPKIKIFMGNEVSKAFPVQLDKLRSLCREGDIAGLVVQLKELVPDYNPGNHMLRYLLQPEASRAPRPVQESPSRIAVTT